ncbi:MAG: preprotein translocase subunit SecA [Patescibacteria group bacterium]
MSFLSKIFSNTHTSSVKKFEPMVTKVNGFEAKIQALSDVELKAKTKEFRRRLGVDASLLAGGALPRSAIASSGDSPRPSDASNNISALDEAETLDDILPEAFAVVREAARRTLSQRHFDVQLVGGMVLHSGAISEMRTGEGKTLVATLPAYLNALTGKGVHIVTVNDYLSRRDAVWMGQVYDFLGLSVGVINHEASFLYDSKTVLDKERDIIGGFKVVHEFLKACTRREAYAADITYGTNNEFGFDYLRDNLEYNPALLRQREPNYAIVDEIDSILIDEARTPLIISAPTRDAEAVYKQFAALVSTFKENEDYTVDEKKKAISLLYPGIEKAEKSLGIDNIYTDKNIKFVHHLETAIRARALFHLNKEYVVKENQIVIVDEFTGRLQPGRRWSEGLHQAIEAKEGVSIQQESRTYASITFQNFFRMYPKLSGMTGTAATSSEEFYKVYGLEVFIVPTNQAMVRLDRNDQIFRTEAGKYKAIARKVKEIHTKGQPVLIGTVSIEKNELLSQFLRSEGVPHEILNAKNHEREGEIIAQAGKKGAVTIATNMAGRGVDIKLGGNPNTPELYNEVKSNGGLFVLGTERHEARRIDNQLRGRSGRQGDPGETQFFVSLEDSLMRVFASDTLKSMMGRLGMPEDEAIEHRIISKSLESAQEKIEGFNFDARKHVLEFDDVINTQRTSVYSRRRRLLLGNVDGVEKELYGIIGFVSATDAVAPSLLVGGALPRSSLRSSSGDSFHPSDGAKNSFTVIEKKTEEFGRENFLNAIRIILLQTIDMYWVEHLEVMDYTRGSVNLRAYGQRDPLVEYKKEGLRLFKEMQNAMREQVMRILPNITPVVSGAPASLGGSVTSRNSADSEMKEIHENAQIIGAGDGSSGSQTIKKEPQVGRNDPCPCGSGKKYKKCHGKN